MVLLKQALFTLAAIVPLASGDTCMLMTEETVPQYHTDEHCDRTAHNGDAKRALRANRHDSLKAAGGVAHIPNQRTIVCPTEPQPLESFDGHDTKWIVENKSSGPVVLAYVKNGIEFSAMTTTITPPQADPEAILPAGHWTSLDTFEGHVFYAREVKPDGTIGDILVQHRPGLVGFSNRYGKELKCDMAVPVEDPEPLVEKVIPPPLERKEQPPRKIVERDPNFSRSPSHRTERCNIQYQGFRNMLPNCPLNIYYAGMEVAVDGHMTCQEQFKFHLGLQETGLRDYMFDWESRTKFEGTFVGHTFVARLANDPSVLVDHFTLQPTDIHDCPGLKQKPIARTVETTITSVGMMDLVVVGNNGTELLEPSNQTGYIWARAPSTR